jgi:hypothetical protein
MRHLCAPTDIADVERLRQLAQQLRPTGARVEFVLVLNEIAACGLYIENYTETFLGKIQARIGAIGRRTPTDDVLTGAIAETPDNMHYDAFAAIASILVCLCADQAVPEDIYAGWVIASHCWSKIHASVEYNPHIHDTRLAYHCLPVSQHIDDEVQLSVIVPMCSLPRPWFRWCMFGIWTTVVSAALLNLVVAVQNR